MYSVVQRRSWCRFTHIIWRRTLTRLQGDYWLYPMVLNHCSIWFVMLIVPRGETSWKDGVWVKSEATYFMLKQTRGMLLCRRYWEMIGISSMRGIRLERGLLMIDEGVYLMLRSLRIRGQYLTNSATTILRISLTNTKTWSDTPTISDNLFIHHSVTDNRKSREDMQRNVVCTLLYQEVEYENNRYFRPMR
jgi:hypothetical protein